MYHLVFRTEYLGWKTRVTVFTSLDQSYMTGIFVMPNALTTTILDFEIFTHKQGILKMGIIVKRDVPLVLM